MVGIDYTGVDGRNHHLDVGSPLEAIKGLSAIPGYSDGMSSGLAEDTSKMLMERRKAQARRYANQPSAYNAFRRVDGMRGGQKVTRLSVCVGAEMDKDGALVGLVMQDLFVPESIGIGGTRTVKVKNNGAASYGSKSGNGMNTVAKGRVGAVIRTEYDKDTHELFNIVGMLSVKNGDIVITGEERETITVAVQETVAQ